MPIRCDIEGVIKSLQEAVKKPDNKKALAKALLNYLEAKENCKDTPLYQFGLIPNKKLSETLAKIQKEEIWDDVVREKAEEYLEEARKKDSKLDYKERRERIMSAIRLLRRLHEDRKSEGKFLKPETLTLLAKAYLSRSKIIYPKGRTVPARKTEAIDEGIKYADEAIEKATNKENAYRCKGMLHVEKERILEKDERTKEELGKIKDALKGALENGCKRFNVLEEGVKIATVYSELSSELDENDNSYLDEIVKSNAPDIELEKARAYRLKGEENEVNKIVGELITKKLRKTHFSDHLWDDTVRFLVRLYKDNKKDSSKFTCWKELASKAWNTCHDIEEEIIFPFHIRWYWSRMRDLYDLAFLAEDNPKEKAKRADSLKSRPSMKLNVLEKLTEDDELMKDLFNEYAIAYMEGYSKKYDELKKKIDNYKEEHPDKFRDPSKVRNIDDVPEGWIVIHFYLNKVEFEEKKEKPGYAIIADSQNPSSWKIEPFKYDKLFNAYMEWQTNYSRSTNKIDSAPYLEKLCIAVGEAMPFLFNLSDDDRPILFIPHDFLHRLPLHGAIKIGNGRPEKVLLEKYPTCYLPAWGFVRKKDGLSSTTPTKSKYLLEKEEDSLSTVIKWDGVYGQFEDIPNNPGLLFINCHGKADSVNPFNARLKIEEKGKTYLDIRNSGKSFNGTRLILGACETDLVPPLSEILDEHLSISTVFLEKNAEEILGTMFEVLTEDAVNLIEYISAMSNSGNLWLMNKLWKCQKEMLKNYSVNYDPWDLYRTIAFRIICIP